MNGNLLPSARAGVVGVIDPDAYAASTITTAWIDMQDFFAIMAILLAGDIVSTGTIDAKFQQATDDSGTGAKDVSGTSITQLTQAGTDSNKQVAINLAQADLDRNNGFRFARLSVTLGTAGADFGAVVVALDGRYGAATATDLTTVDEVA
ncbi:hypothetical protein ACWPMX_07820 [Tsuneonella sp. HG094]